MITITIPVWMFWTWVGLSMVGTTTSGVAAIYRRKLAIAHAVEDEVRTRIARMRGHQS